MRWCRRREPDRGTPPPLPGTPPAPSPLPVLTLYLPRALVRDTHEHFLPYWRARVETACFWFGVVASDTQIATTLALPQLHQSVGNYRVEGVSLRRLSQAMRGQGLTNLAQVHTHPGGEVGHSPYDNQQAYSTREGALSLVWPHYGLRSVHDLRDLGVHERRGGRWVRLGDDEVGRRIRLIDSLADYRWDITDGGNADAE